MTSRQARERLRRYRMRHELHENPVAKTRGTNSTLQEDDLDEVEMQMMYVDRIGDTMYSKSFVLRTLMKLAETNEDLAKNEDFERELCSIWDMTTERDVVLFLVKNDGISGIATCADTTFDKRLCEILVGILGNICALEEGRRAITEQPQVRHMLIHLVECSDTPTLQQVMRLFAAIFTRADMPMVITWLQDFAEAREFVASFWFILKNNCNKDLLAQTLETLNAIVDVFPRLEMDKLEHEVSKKLMKFRDACVYEDLIEGTIVAFNALVPPSKEKSDESAAIAELQTCVANSRRVVDAFVNIHRVLARHNEIDAEDEYEPHVDQMVRCIVTIMEPMLTFAYMPHITPRELEMLEGIIDIFEGMGNVFNEMYCLAMFKAFDVLRRMLEFRGRNTPPLFDHSSDELNVDDFYFEDAYRTALYSISRCVDKYSMSELVRIVSKVPETGMKGVIAALEMRLDEPEEEKCYDKLKIAIKCWKGEISPDDLQKLTDGKTDTGRSDSNE